jgi:hypothetical protein
MVSRWVFTVGTCGRISVSATAEKEEEVEYMP